MPAKKSGITLYAKIAMTVIGGLFTLAELMAASGFAPLASVAFEYSPRGHVMVPVSVNGKNGLQFALDTGAGGHVLKPATADALDIELRDPPPNAHVQGAHAKYQAKFAELDTLSVGGLTAKNQRTAVIDVAHVERNLFELDGVLGIPFIGDYRIAIDFKNQIVDFYDQGSETDDWLSQYGDMQPVEYSPRFGGLIFFDTMIGDVKVAAVLDTGAGHSAVNSKAAEALGLSGDRDTFDIVSEKLSVDIDSVALTTDMDIEISDVPVFKVFGMDDEPAILIGTDFLKDRVLAIAYDTETLYVSR